MLSTKNLVIKESDIPSYWVFQYYLNVNEKLDGQDVKITSVWNPSEKTPSMCIYVDVKKQCYMFKDFSTGKGGNKINLIQLLFDIGYSDAVEKMIKDYNVFIKSNTVEKTFKIQPKWEIELVKLRDWNNADANYWLKYRIGKTMLEKYNVKPIEYYNMVKQDGETLKKIKIKSSYMYGYYNKNGDLYKIYQPYNNKQKFHKVISYTQGIDQLNYDKPYLVIASSLKDVMAIDSIGYNIELIAPDSENTVIKPYIIENLKNKYKKVITLFDNDIAGKKAIDRYKDLYDINGTHINTSKDPSDCIKEYGWEKLHEELKPLLKETIHK